MKEEEMKAKMCYDVDFFAECCFCCCLGSQLLYWHVRSRFTVWGTKIDGVTRKPLFNNIIKDRVTMFLGLLVLHKPSPLGGAAR
jgi:hypothetical protein